MRPAFTATAAYRLHHAECRERLLQMPRTLHDNARRDGMADEPLFMGVRDSDPAFQQTIRDARATLPEFRRLLASPQLGDAFPLVKIDLADQQARAVLWLIVRGVQAAGFRASIFEIPSEFAGYKVGDVLDVPETAVLDWMLNQDGVLHGGFSLRYQRALLPEEKRAEFDRHIGVLRYH
ncbi:MAG TPA: DUF2314 domain-containing protein [Longimicrobium sp.]|nr:DUF2314 domain-containing protein [Longimicrobium sp.]